MSVSHLPLVGWRAQARCRDLPPEEADRIFYPDGERGSGHHHWDEAKAFCRECPVVHSCREHALDNDERDGCWGATSPSDRHNIRNGLTRGTEEYPSTLISVPTVGPNERVHVTQKPTALLEQLLRVVSDSEGLVVLDPFMGSGSTLEAAKRLGHRVVGIEVDERYCEAAVDRLRQGALFGGAA